MKVWLYVTVVICLEALLWKNSHAALTCPNVNITSETQYICEGYQGTISCANKPGTVINIAYANYGRRTGADTCPDSDMYNQYCYAVNSTLIVKNQCESKVSCKIWANNTVFGDPCADTYKYLEVRIHCKAAGDTTVVTEPYFPSLSYSYQMGVEAIIVDKKQTIEAQVYYSYYMNRAAISVTKEGRTFKNIYNFDADEIYKTSDYGCTVEQLSTSNDTYSTWLFPYTYLRIEMDLHIAAPRWQVDIPYDVEYGELYIGNTTVRDIPVDHWQICGYWQPNSTMLIDYYFSRNQGWQAALYGVAPVRTEVRADKLYPNGTVYNLHHIYNFHNYNYYYENNYPNIFETPIDVVCPGRKDTKPVPMIPDTFYYRVEIVDTSRDQTTYEDVWYDGKLGYYRRDYRPLYNHYPTFNTNPISEIHDYNIGVRYLTDKTQGNCTILPLTNTSGDATMNFTSQNNVDSYILNLKNPLQLFNLDVNYTYIGQYMERGVLCDVYVAVKPHLYISGFLDLSLNTTVTFWFLSKYWSNYDNQRVDTDRIRTPVKMELHAKTIGFKAVYNYVEFNADYPWLEVFDIAPCFPDNSKLKFQVKFPGTYKRPAGTMLKDMAHREFARHLNVSLLRIQEVTLLYDDFYLYISATLLDRPPAPAQFEYIPGQVLEKIEDSVVRGVLLPMQCADFCISNQGFICNSFDFCPNDQTCRLSNQHVGDGTAVLSSSRSCDHFSRSVQGTIPTLDVQDAYSNLRNDVYQQSVTLKLPDSDTAYTAVDISVVFGWMTSKVVMPQFGDSFQYKIEITIPYLKYAYEAQIWYDKTLQKIREDVHFDTIIAPVNPVTMINDFQTGLQYVTDRVNKNCTVRPIHTNTFGATLNYAVPIENNSTWSLRMKTPQELFFIDDTYDFVGQKTVRGMLCNVFESLRLDYKLSNLNTDSTYQSVFRYFFLADGWYEVSEEQGGSRSQPVQLEITILELDLFLEYVFYDFNDDRPDISTYDVNECFDPTDQYTFQITFPGPYHPYLDTLSSMFQTESVFAMSRMTLLPPMRFQRTTLYYDNNNIYITTTMVGEPRILSYYTYVQQGSVPQHPEGVYDEIQNLDACVQLCYTSTSFVCNSFYYCPNELQCLFSKQHVPNTPAIKSADACQAYSRTVTAMTYASPSIDAALRSLKNSIYRGNLMIVIPGPGILESPMVQWRMCLLTRESYRRHEFQYSNSEQIFFIKPYKYIATSIRTDMVGASPQAVQANPLHRFTIFKNNSESLYVDSETDNLSVDECAKACLDTRAFQCQGFYYCDTTFMCGLVKTHPSRLPIPPTNSTLSCYIYQRDYLDDYIESPGYVMATSALISYYPVSSSSECAQECSQGDSLHCRSFEFCDNTKECFLFQDRTVGTPRPRGITQCSYFTRNYLVNFQPASKGSFIFSSVIQFSSVTPSQCAQVCVEQQGTSCYGFYFCHQSTACYLTSMGSQSNTAPGESKVVVDKSFQASICTFYTLIEPIQPSVSSSTSSLSPSSTTTKTTTTATSAPPVTITCPTFPTSTSTPSTSTSTSTSTTTTTTPSTTATSTTTSTTTRPSIAMPTCSCPQKTVLVPVTWTPVTTKSGLPTALHLTSGENTKNGKDKTNAGLLVGVAIATFILGLVMGGAVSFFFQKRRPKKTESGDEECEMNFTKMEDNHVKDSSN